MTEQHLASQINIEVETAYVRDPRVEEQEKYAFSYHVTISNQGSETVQLLNRYWLITDGNGKQTEVAGPGVVGETPVLASGESFSYSSGAILDTPVGFMQGHYEFQCKSETEAEAELFKAPIAVFTLSVPNSLN